MDKNQDETVTHRTKGNKKIEKDISQEPEMIELQRMIDSGQLDKERAVQYIAKEVDTEEMEYVNKLLDILRSEDEKSKHALRIMINQLYDNL